MNINKEESAFFSDTKKHYIILDGLRGVAAVVVVIFHLLETFTFGNSYTQIVNHGYLAVDFFFMLSGFVIGYAYDDRWKTMTTAGFFKRRLIRLHPMIIIGMIFGAVTFYFQDSSFFPGISDVPVWKMLLIMLIGFTLIPITKSMDIRGWQEMHPLNGPAWSLFFEYVANILYGLFIRKFSNKALSVLVIIAGILFLQLSLTKGDVIGGWSIDVTQLQIGFTRLLYPFFAGLLLSRIVKPGTIKNAFFLSSLILVVVLSVPRLGGPDHHWMNGLYVAISVIAIFPLIIYMGASGKITGKFSLKLCRFLGDISYPLYMMHFPLVCIFMTWVANNNVSLLASIPMMLLILFLSTVLAYGSFKLYDVPVRKWLTRKFLPKK